MGGVLQDLRYAIRGMRRTRGFTATAIVPLAFGAAAISTVLTLAYTLFLRDLPVIRPDRVVAVQATRRHGRVQGWVDYPDYIHFRQGTRTLEGLAAHYSTAPLFVSANHRSEEVNGAVVSADYFPLLGIRPAIGRFFRPDEDSVPDRDRVAVIAYDFWTTWFSSSPDALGAAITINGAPFTIIGVAPPSFRGITVSPNEIYMPLMMARVGYRWCPDSLGSGCDLLDMIGRLRDGYAVEQARAEMAALMPVSWTSSKEGENSGIQVVRARGALHADLPRDAQIRFIEVLFAVAAVLLIICCVNLAGLLTARNDARTREFAIRASLGAGSFRLIRQLLAEIFLLTGVGAALGVVFSLALVNWLNSSFYTADPESHPQYYDFTPQPGVVAVVVALCISAGLAIGIPPAFKLFAKHGLERLRQQSQSFTERRRLGRWLAAAQAAVAVALAAMSGLLATSAHAMLQGANYDAPHVALLRLRPRLIRYTPDQAAHFLRSVMRRLDATPGVESASMVGTGAVLLGQQARVSLPGSAEAQSFESGYIEIGPRYFETLRTPLLRGREFNDRDTQASAPVAVVSETLARRLWPAGNVIGAIVVVNGSSRQVVGIVQDVPLQTRGETLAPYVFIPFWQNPEQVDARLCVRVKGDPAAMLSNITRVVNAVDPSVPIAETTTLRSQTAGRIMPARMTSAFVSYAAALAVLLSAVGLYSTVAFSVSRRTKEIGIRMAVGAESSAVLAMVIREGMGAVGAGILAGLALAIGGTGIIRHLLYGSGQADGFVYAAAAGLVACAALFACWIPARRAAAVEPLAALRDQ